jgi:hypothetical protein
MKSKIDFFATLVLMLIIFVGLIMFIFNMHGWRFYLEFLVLIGLMIIALLSLPLIFNKINFGYILSGLISAISLINFVWLYFKQGMGTLLFASIVASMTGFVISVVSIEKKKSPVEHKEIKKPDKNVILKTYTPGKFVTSKTSSYYHAPACEWAHKIKVSNQEWYDSEDSAKKAGLKKHNCIK